MKKGILYHIINNRKVTLFVTVMIILTGIFSYNVLVKQESPDFEIPFVIMNISYVGASASEVEKTVMSPLEESMKQIDGYKHYTSYSKNNGGTYFMEFAYDIDREETFNEARTTADDFMLSMPEDVELVSYTAGSLTTTGFIYSLIPKGEQNMEELEDAAEFIADKISDLEMVSSTYIQGNQETKIVVEVNNDAINKLTLTRYNLASLISTMDSRLPGGTLNDEDSTSVQSLSSLNSQSDVENLIVGVNPATGTPITVNDFASISKENIDTVYTKYDGKQGVLIYGYFEENIDQTDFAESLKTDINDIVSDYSDEYELSEIVYYPDDVKESNDEFFVNLLIGIGLVILISFFSMGYRNAIIVSVSLPTSVMMTLAIMKIMEIKLHQISIAALIIAIGMLVDNAIVITESMKRRIEEGDDRFTAVIDGTKEVAIPVLTSTITTIAAFSPLLFIPSIAGDYIKSVPQVLIIALSSSYIVSVTLMPCLAYIIFNKLDKKTRKGRFINFAGKSVGWLLKKKVLVIIAVVILAVFAAVVFTDIGLSFFPKADKDILYINVTNKEGNDIENTKEKMLLIEEEIAKQDNISHYLMSVGNGAPRFWDTMRPFFASPDFGQFIVQVELDEEYISNTEYAEYLQRILNNIDDPLKIEVMELQLSEPILAPISIQVTSDSLDDLYDAKEYTIDILNKIDGVTYIRDDEADSINQYDIEYNMSALTMNNLVLSLVQTEVNFAINGYEAAAIRDGDDQIPIKIIDYEMDYDDLMELIVGHNAEGKAVKLSEIAQIHTSSNKSSITRYDGKYAITVLTNVKSGYSSGDIMEEFRNSINEDLFNSIKWQYSGEQQSIIDNFSDVGMMALFAAFLIVLIIVIQFNSFRQTAIIIMSIPLAASGAIYGLYVTGYPLSFTALFGTVSLMGIVVNNAILLIDSINNKRRDGLTVNEATIIGTKRRIRPILLTTLTTIIGLVPLMVSGSELFAPMAIAIGSGLLFSTIITLLLIPVLYSILVRDKSK